VSDIEQIVTAIRTLPTLTMGNLVKLICATEQYADQCNLYGDVSEVQDCLLDALSAAEDVRAYTGEEHAA
jgi:hypothetical protein